LVVPPQEPSALALALERLINDPKSRQAMGQAGREFVVRRFSSSIINHATHRVYRQLMEEIPAKKTPK
jgi:glycosyltransferase involved in cell wall biosynthesis